MAFASKWFLLLYLGLCAAWMDERPVLESRDGHLIISSAKDRNITLKLMGGGYINVNDINLLHVASAAQNATRVIDRWRMGYLAEMENSLYQLTTIVTGATGLQRRVSLLERSIDMNSTIRAGNRSRIPTFNPIAGITRSTIRRINARLKALEDSVRAMQALLRENECQSNPCQNGGTCEDLYDAYQCHCPSNWEGPNCMTDVNECARFLGTDLGCQNGATCRNSPGSYRCDCLPGWFGLHCTQKTSICNTENSEALCGEHGVCVAKSGSALGYTCICDQGWESDGTTPACTKDVDECAAAHPPCSVNPPVPCLNTRGSFTCGACPHGYSGNGYYCTDIDECLINNGGCSTSPYVQCMNTMGSRTCGACPPGYRGDGVSCIFVGGCAINNGGCHPLATCTENPSLTSSYVLCRCPPDYVGNGMGPNGCQLSDVSLNTACSSNLCVHGTCVPYGANDYTCTCNPGYSGATCNIPTDPCSPNPCRNNGICIVLSGRATCQCTTSFTGNRCETPRQACGGMLRNPTGTVQFPIGGSTYQHGLSCAWVLKTDSSKVLNVTFTAFNIEQSTDCKFDFLQIHDGENTGTQLINRFCGHELPNGNGTIISSHNTLYLWFHSDNSISHDGFTFHWNSIDPVCGGVLENNFGTIMSPGSPGKYPPNRDCFWRITVAASKRIQFHFGQLMLEQNCQNDYVEITGIEGKRLGLFCNHTRPPPLITPSSEATVHFHSDSSKQDAGFQIHYSTIEGSPGCGGIYTSATGLISSPGHSTAYLPNMECEWKIQLPVGERIRASWLKFNIETSSSCQFDFVEIYDGPDTNSQLLGRYCGSDMPPAIKSNSNKLVVLFKSDWSYESEGFTLSYETLCGGEFHEDTGIIKSPFYPNPYHHSTTCIYEIIQPSGKGIILTMEDMDIEGRDQNCYYDYVEIFDGDNENATNLAKLCGDEENMPDTPYYSTHNFMYIKFTTDNSIDGRGFKANYTTIDRRCGGLLKQPSGVIQPPLENGFYVDNEECIWTIQAPPGYVIQLTWMSFNLEYHVHCVHDYVNIYENYTLSDKNIIATYCGTTKPPDLTTQDSTLTILFHTDSSVTSDGFVATYIFMDMSKVCGGHYSKENGIIKSPNYPDHYPNKKECVWIIEAQNRHRIILTVNHFELERHASCVFDYLEIRNGGYESSPLIGKFCGKDIPTEIPSQANQMYIRFVSDFSRSWPGFEIQWNSATEGCGSTLTTVTGDIISPNYPEPYSANADCYWKIAVAAGSLVQLVIVDLDLEQHEKCRYDFIEIYDGISYRTNGRRYCGTSYPKIIQSESNQMTVRFRSDFSNSGRGFHLKYETQCYLTAHEHKLHGYYGVIESPNFPNKYEHSTNCSWIIEAPIGNTINLTFSHFDLEGTTEQCTYDYLQIMEGDDDKANNNLTRLCGSIDLPKKINSMQHQVFITFVTDSFIAFNGFRLEWTVHGCGGHLTKPYDTFTSPGYPSAYPTNIECEWLIEVDYTHSVELTFYDINTEKRKGCIFDKVQIYKGDKPVNESKLTELCYTEKPVTYTSPGHKMFVKFHSDSSYSNRGFNASYRSVPIGCGGKFTAISGIIHSANYPQNYPHVQNCEWLLEVDSNHLVNLTFLDFDVENSWNCSDDFVEIFDGPTKNNSLLGIHCSNQLPPIYLSSSNQMLVVMQSDSIISAKGFKAQYSRACGARIIVKDHGFLTPPVGNSDTHGDTNCTWILIAEDPADHITITFTHMEIDPIDVTNRWESTELSPCFWLSLQVFEGESIDGPLLGKWCNNVAPPPITSTGSSLTLHLAIHYEFIGHFVATYSVLNTACGGNYTSEQGIITSPSYPNSYPLNAECVWILNTSPGNKVTLVFSEFDIESSDSCDLDYLEIREDNGIGKLISVSCGKDAAEITSSNKLWIKFKSDGSGTAKGFKAEYNILGGNELDGFTGRITSPLYPLPYRRSASFSWRITVEMNSLIRITFTDLQIENIGEHCFSNIKIYDGYDNEAATLLEVCGYSLPDPVESSSNVVYIMMSTDFVRQGNWFDLTWLQIPKNTEQGNKEIKLSECNKEIALMGDRNNTYSFSSPGWPTGYAANLHCNWVFTSPPGTHLVLRIMTMDLEETNNCVADSVSVYSGYALTSTTDAHLESKLCLANASMSLVSGTNVMTVKFDTDMSVNKTGFNAYVYRECGGQLTDPNGVIEYDNSSYVKAIRTWHFTCEWTVTVRPGKFIKVEITDMSIQEMPDHTCGDNYLMLKNGDGMLSPLLGNGKYCGEVISAELETTGNRFYVKATGTGNHFRFRLTYRETSMNCGGEFVLTSKQKKWEITSPNYPNIPPTYAECIWKATAPAGEKLTIHFLDRFDLSNSENCDREYVEIRDGGTDSSQLMGKFCKDVAPSSMSTIGNMVYIHFYTDVPEPKNGFKAVIVSGEVCGGILRTTTGVIESPNYPNPYPQNQSCSWLIVAPTDHTLKLQFRDINLPGFRGCSTDHVNIGEKLIENDTISIIGTYCGLQKPDVIETSTNKAYVNFESDNRDFVTYHGFSLNFTASQETCGGSLTALNGIIKSPGYPNPRTRARYCDWRIELPVGYQVVVNILDIDVVSGPGPTHVGYALSFYNDFRFKSKIKVLGQGATSMEEIRSSSNTMIIGYWSSAGHRGFKLRYTAEAPAPCGGTLREVQGNITGPTIPPFNQSSYVCHWKLLPPENMISPVGDSRLTMTMKVIGLLGGPERSSIIRRNCIYPQYIEVQDIGMLCGNITEPRYLRSPKLLNELTIMNGTYGRRMDFTLQYQWQACGGILRGPRHTIRSPTNISYPINCVWHVDYPEEETIKLTFTKLELESNCDRNYLIIRNGGPTAPQIAKHCIHATTELEKYNINSISNQLWVEYFASEGSGSFEFDVVIATAGCGGSLHGRSREIASPAFPKQYPNNGECTWEIIGDNGYHIGLIFVDRFSLETSSNCEKDYVQVFDWVREQGNYDNGEWKSLGKVCGRNTPMPFNSTTNRMKVIFHSNEAVQADGFHAVWSENCGGVFQATEKVNVIQSPSYPNLYPNSIFCNYTIVAPNDDIVVEFTDFQLERGRGGDCRFDNVTVISESMYFTEDVESYCGNNKPPLLRSLSRIGIIFATDKYVQRSGFQFKYFLNRCGGIITRPSELKPLMHGEEYFGRMNCTWIIKAPQGKSVLVRFEKFILEYSTNCYFDNVAVYEGEFVQEDKRHALFCGNLTGNLPTFKSESNSMVVNFNADSSRHYEGFTAKVLFTTSPASGCGGLINLTSSQSKSFRTQQAATYEPFEECHWTVVTSPAKTIIFTINSIDIKNSINNITRRDKCSGDYLEVRDGGGPYAELIGQFCGSSVPSPLVSTSNKLWIRFYSDGTSQGAGATGTLETNDALCGLGTRVVNETNHVLTSPNYPNTHLAGTLCRWTLKFTGEFSDRLRIRFIDFDLMDSNKCEYEYLEISEQNKYINEGFGTNFIYSGVKNHPISVEMGSRLPLGSYRYCGSALPHEYYSYNNEVKVTFRSLSNDHRGFKLEYSTASCDRNYTSEQGRIFHNGFTSCWITITVPANHTISLYFNHFSIYDGEQCTRNGLQVHEGDSSGPLIATLCSTMMPSPIFSSGNKLTLHSWTEIASSYQSYDIIYTTTDAGRGCGGRIFNYGGRFTSPLYPNIYRNNTVCTWDVSVPRGFKIILQFLVFDIGTKKTCSSNNLKIYDVVPSGELLHSTYCGGDDPARLEADTDRILVKYTSTVNNIGTGWVIAFMAQSTGKHSSLDNGMFKFFYEPQIAHITGAR